MQKAEKLENSEDLFCISGLDMWGGDFSSRKVDNLDEAVQVAKGWVTDQTRCATYWEGDKKVYFKFVQKCNPSKSTNHMECTSFFKGTIL